jgi:hypothetical protein
VQSTTPLVNNNEKYKLRTPIALKSQGKTREAGRNNKHLQARPLIPKQNLLLVSGHGAPAVKLAHTA